MKRLWIIAIAVVLMQLAFAQQGEPFYISQISFNQEKSSITVEYNMDSEIFIPELNLLAGELHKVQVKANGETIAEHETFSRNEKDYAVEFRLLPNVADYEISIDSAEKLSDVKMFSRPIAIDASAEGQNQNIGTGKAVENYGILENSGAQTAAGKNASNQKNLSVLFAVIATAIVLAGVYFLQNGKNGKNPKTRVIENAGKN